MSPNNLPTQPTPFVGRTAELAKITALLINPACRLLTLIGSGGMGKTRLALEAARLQADDFSDGAYFVPLQPLGSAHLILPAIAQAVDFQFSPGGEPKDQLLSYLRSKTILLVMDNLEHLLDGVGLLSELLAFAPNLKILATSRERLNMVEEWVFEVGGLNFPASETELEIENYSAVQLFLQNAQRISAGFQLNDGVARICRIVDGMPLALEMAAAWVRVMSCQQIAAEIEQSLGVLETPLRNIPLRHRNMRAVFEPTWNRLLPTEQDVFMRLSVFRGGFTHAAAQAVAGASLPILATLIDKSLLRRTPDDRYDIHELLRQYGEEHLVQSGSREITQDAHSTYYLNFLAEREPDIKGRRQVAALNEIETDFENIRVAWHWVVQRKDYPALNRALESLFYFCEMRCRFQDAHELLREAEAPLRTEPNDNLRAIWGRIFIRGIWVTRLKDHEFEKPVSQMQDCLAIARQQGDQAQVAFCLWLWGALDHFTRSDVRCIGYLEESLALFTELGDRFYMGRAADWLGAVYGWNNQFEKFVHFSQQSLDWRRAIGDRFGMAASLINLGGAANCAGQYDQSKRYFEEMEQIYLEIGSRGWAVRVTANLSWIALQRGDFREAQRLAEKALEHFAQGNEVVLDGKRIALSILGMLAVLEEDYAQSGELCELALFEQDHEIPTAEECLALTACGLRDYANARHYFFLALKPDISAHDFRGMTQLLPVAAILLAHENQPTRAAELLGLAFHHHASAKAWIEQWPLLTRLRAQLEAELGTENYAAAWERGKLLDLKATALNLLHHFQPAASPQMAQASNHALVEPLSEREFQVLQQIAAGLSNSEIAAQLVVEISTIKKHINHLYDKLGVKTRTQALLRARELSLL